MSNPMPFSRANAQQNAMLSAKVRQRPNPVRMLNDMQDQLMSAVMDKETEPREKAQCALAWDKLEARKAVLNGLPANTSQSIRSEAKPKKSRSSVGPLEPVQVELQSKPKADTNGDATGPIRDP